jgi:hypothetical protein
MRNLGKIIEEIEGIGRSRIGIQKRCRAIHPKEIRRFGRGTTRFGEILEDMRRSFIPKNFQC